MKTNSRRGMAVTKILGVEIDRVTFSSAVEQIEGFIEHGQPHQVVTVNPEFIMRAQTDRAFRKILNEADLAVPDGAGLLWASRVLNRRARQTARWPRRYKTNQSTLILPERVTGTDLLPALAARAAENGWKIYLLGGAPGVAQRTAEVLKKHWSELRVVGAESGPLITDAGKPLNVDQDALLTATLERIIHTKPDLLFVALGAPKQDRFIARFRSDLKVPVMMGVGGAFDFIIGSAKRAPRIFQILWLEWLWRLIMEPRRAGRIWTAAVRFPLAVWRAI